VGEPQKAHDPKAARLMLTKPFKPQGRKKDADEDKPPKKKRKIAPPSSSSSTTTGSDSGLPTSPRQPSPEYEVN